MAQLDISESRLPQDGRVKLNLDGREIDLRVSTIPTVHGEAIVMRILDKQMMLVGIKQIGMTDELLQRYMHFIRKPNGIVLVTGPSGCGKTTTLYASISEINDPGEKFITTEDPVEYQLDGILQININANVGLTFARCLRSILRHDPDRVLVGEIRDVETAQIAVQAALTGHLVFSTLHTNSAAGTITRLIEMGLKPFLITSSLQAIVAQRLVRTICSQCRTPCRPDPLELEMFGVTPADVRDKTFYRGEGCGECGHTGYRGRMGLFEMLELDDEMSELILDQGSTDEIHALAVRNGMITMRQDGWLKICLGLTTFEEVMRETPREEEVEILTGAPEDEEKGAEEVEAKEKKPLEPKPKPQISDKTGVPEGEAAALPPPVQGDAEKR
jgi:type II secretory ATPase GspE/PulE/Tfp pilus assembly ATPase PilB-like protein